MKKLISINKVFIFASLLMFWPLAGAGSNSALFEELAKAVSSGRGAKARMTLGGADQLKKAIAKKPQIVHTVNSSGESLLHIAVRYTNVNAVNILIKAGADLNKKDREGGTPLYTAACQSNAKDRDHRSWIGETDLKNRTIRNLNIMKALIKAGADVNAGGILHAAARNNSLKVIELLVKAGADVNGANLYGKKSHTPITYTFGVFHDRPDAALILIKAGAKLNIYVDHPSYMNKTMPLLHYAAWAENFKTLKVFVENGINVNAVDSFGQNIFHFLVRRGDGSLGLFKFLKDSGANINALDKKGLTPLDLAQRRLSDYLDHLKTMYVNHDPKRLDYSQQLEVSDKKHIIEALKMLGAKLGPKP